MSNTSDKALVDNLVQQYAQLKDEIGKVIVGQEDVVRDVVMSIFAKGHCLLVGVPGLAKTLLVNTISQTLGLSFSRIQFTPDLMPSDITGAEILDQNKQFKFVKGPVFANIVLADEINRTPPKTQAALLEAMQERNVTAAGQEFKLPAPFFVLATQNPIEQEGTYALPEAQLDRFMFNIKVGYPTKAEEMQIVKSTTSDHKAELSTILSADQIMQIQDLIRRVPVADNVIDYAVSLVGKTRPGTPEASEFVNNYLSWGAGPRASQYLILGAKVHAAIHGKYSPDIEDVKAVANAVLRHRLVRTYRAEADGITVERIIEEIS